MNSPGPLSALPRLGKYEIVEEIGHGGMATVYRAVDDRLGREVAIKVVHKHLRGSSEVAARFAAEARAVAKLRHPNILEVYDVSEDGDPERFIVCELLHGVTLRHVLQSSGEMPPEVAAALGLELCAALAHAHAAGIVHRDVKPENVMIDTPVAPLPGVAPRPVVKLMDFGIAKILDAQGVTSTGQVLGSPAHMAPEQIEGAEVDARADVFGVGVLLYECMAGHLPFEGKNPAQVLRRVLEGVCAPADRSRPSVGGRWAKILARALAKVAADRQPSADALAADLRSELTHLGFKDPGAELGAFLRDPAGYRAAHPARMIPTLTKRGDESRRSRDIIGAAADFNRALAYAPHDGELMKQVARLSARRARPKRLLTGGALLAGLLMTLLAVRWLVQPRPRSGGGASGTDPAIAAPGLRGPAVQLGSSAVAAPSALAGSRPPVAVGAVDPARAPERPPAAPPRAKAGGGPREVQVLVRPNGALVSVDGGPAESWFQRTHSLAAGPHVFRAYVPNSRCCDELRKTEEIHGEDGSGPQVVALSLRFRSAMLTVRGAPPEARLSCPLLRVDGAANQVYQLPMGELEMTAACDLEEPGAPSRTTSTTLRAGELVAVPWTNP